MLKIEPYLSFEGRTDEAIEFYKEALGAKITMLMRFKDGPPGSCGDGTSAPGPRITRAKDCSRRPPKPRAIRAPATEPASNAISTDGGRSDIPRL